MKTLKFLMLLSLLSIGAAQSRAVTLLDDFSVSHDYSGGSVSGTIWNGVINAGNTTNFNTTTNSGVLTIEVDGAANTGWDSSHTSSPLLYIDVSGDFTASVQYTGGTNNGYSDAGLMLFADNSNFLQTRFFAASSFNGFREVVGGSQTDTNPGSNRLWLQLSRAGNLYTSAASDDGVTWSTLATFSASGSLANLNQKIGLEFGNYGGSSSSNGQFDNFSLTTVPEPSTWALIGVGLGCLVLSKGFRRRKTQAAVI